MHVKEHMGDSVYAQINDYRQLVLTVCNGEPNDPQQIMVIEPPVWRALVRYVEALGSSRYSTPVLSKRIFNPAS